MNKILLVLSVFFLINSNGYSDVDGNGVVIPSSIIRASDMNTLFSSIKNRLAIHNYEIEFELFQAGEVISRNKILNELNKIPVFIDQRDRGLIGGLIASNNLSEIFSFVLNKIDNYENFFTKFNAYYDEVCNCYKNVPYTADNVSWTIDSKIGGSFGRTFFPVVSEEGYQKLDIYVPNVSNNKVVFYSHEMGNSKSMNSGNGLDFVSIRNYLVSLGYYFISVEFRHPSLDSVSTIEQAYDLSKAYSFVREHYHDFGLSNPDKFYSLSYSKGSLIIANTLSDNLLSSDRFGKHTFEKIYAFDPQVTFHKDSYFSLFIKDQTCSGVDTGITCFNNVNNMMSSLFGISLNTTSLGIAGVDTYLHLTGQMDLKTILAGKYPKVRMGFINEPLLEKDLGNKLTTSFGNHFPYFLHNPRGINAFCNKYLNKIESLESTPCLIGPGLGGTCSYPTDHTSMCSGNTGLNSSGLVLNDILLFFE